MRRGQSNLHKTASACDGDQPLRQRHSAGTIGGNSGTFSNQQSIGSRHESRQANSTWLSTIKSGNLTNEKELSEDLARPSTLLAGLIALPVSLSQYQEKVQNIWTSQSLHQSVYMFRHCLSRRKIIFYYIHIVQPTETTREKHFLSVVVQQRPSNSLSYNIQRKQDSARTGSICFSSKCERLRRR